MSERKPCPFCGCDGKTWYTDHAPDCFIRLMYEIMDALEHTTEERHGYDALTNAWNTRVGEKE